MKASVTRYPGEDGQEDQIVIRLCPENAAILLEILGSVDTQIMDPEGTEEPVDSQSITAGTVFESLHGQLTKEERSKFYLYDNNAGDDGIDFCVCRRKGD